MVMVESARAQGSIGRLTGAEVTTQWLFAVGGLVEKAAQTVQCHGKYEKYRKAKSVIFDYIRLTTGTLTNASNIFKRL